MWPFVAGIGGSLLVYVEQSALGYRVHIVWYIVRPLDVRVFCMADSQSWYPYLFFSVSSSRPLFNVIFNVT